jgi:glycosyltransferase involved in cell wall biosynthesis
MKIDWYSHYFTPEVGAPSARLNDLSRCFIHQGHQAHVNTCYPNHPKGVLYPGYQSGRYMEEIVSGIDVSRYWSYIAANRGFVKKLAGHVSFLLSSMVQSQRNRNRADVVIGTSPTFFAAMAAAEQSLRRQIPFVMEVRDLWPAIFVELGVLKNPFLIGMLEKLELWLYRKAARVVTVTESFRQDLIRRGVPPEKVVTIPNGADVDYWVPQESVPGLKDKLGLENKFVVLYIGAHGISHALTRILECAGQLKEHPDIRFVFVGDGAERPTLLEYARREHLENVTFHQSVEKEQVMSFYALSDVCLVPLRDIPLFDSFIPSKMFEIMAMSRPVVASLKGEAADIIKRSGGGIVVKPEDASAIKNAILNLFDNRQLCRELGQNGRRFVCDNYSRKELADRYLSVLEDAIEVFNGGSSPD